MAAAITETEYNVSPNLGGKIIKFKGTKAAQNDWIIFDDPVGCVVANQLDGTCDIVAYAVGAVHTSGITDSAVTMIYDGVTADQMPASGYIMVANEIMSYAAGGAEGSTGGTLTGMTRGCFGTTATAASDGDTMYLLNTIVFSDTVTGLLRGIADVIEE